MALKLCISDQRSGHATKDCATYRTAREEQELKHGSAAGDLLGSQHSQVGVSQVELADCRHKILDLVREAVQVIYGDGLDVD